MIPKIIHTFWGGDCDVRDKSFLWNWEEVLVPAGYEIKVWKPEDFTDIDCDFYKKVVEYKQWAHASDYIRFKVLNEYGGFWLDTDVFVFKPFDELLDTRYIITKSHEYNGDNIDLYSSFDWICLSAFGIEKGDELTEFVLDAYNGRKFSLDMTGFRYNDVAYVFMEALKDKGLSIRNFDDFNDLDGFWDTLKDSRSHDTNHVNILPSMMFDYKPTDKPLHELMFASHKHWNLWHPSFAELTSSCNKIPKIIHTFWGGDCDVRDKSFLWNWEEVLVPAGYEIKVWKPEDFDCDNTPFLRKALKNGFWAHASDYIRFKVLNEYGGFWMDTDVFVFKPFDKLLKAEYIISLANGGDWENKDSFNNCNIHNTFKFCMSCVGFKKGHPIVQGILNEYKKTGYDIIDSGYECMDVSSFMLRYLSENNLNVTELTDINYTEKLYGELDELTKFDGENVVLLPPCMFDYRYADESLHELMYASHKHWSLWTPKYSESIEKVKLTDKLVDELTGDVIVSISEKVKNLLFSEFKKEIKDTIVKSLKDKYNDKIDFNLI